MTQICGWLKVDAYENATGGEKWRGIGNLFPLMIINSTACLLFSFLFAGLVAACLVCSAVGNLEMPKFVKIDPSVKVVSALDVTAPQKPSNWYAAWPTGLQLTLTGRQAIKNFRLECYVNPLNKESQLSEVSSGTLEFVNFLFLINRSLLWGSPLNGICGKWRAVCLTSCLFLFCILFFFLFQIRFCFDDNCETLTDEGKFPKRFKDEARKNWRVKLSFSKVNGGYAVFESVSEDDKLNTKFYCSVTNKMGTLRSNTLKILDYRQRFPGKKKLASESTTIFHFARVLLRSRCENAY